MAARHAGCRCRAARIGPSALLLAALLLLAAGRRSDAKALQRAPPQRQPVEFSPSVALFFVNDVLLHSRTHGAGHSQWTSSRCLDMVFRASMYNAKRINFVVTSYFLDTNGGQEQPVVQMAQASAPRRLARPPPVYRSRAPVRPGNRDPRQPV